MNPQDDPLALAREITAAYVESTKREPIRQPTSSRIVLEEAKPRGGGPAKKAAPRSGEPWTDEERMRLVRAFLKGVHTGTISMELGRTPGSVESQLKQIGFTDDQIYG